VINCKVDLFLPLEPNLRYFPIAYPQRASKLQEVIRSESKVQTKRVVVLPHKPVSGSRKYPLARTWNSEERKKKTKAKQTKKNQQKPPKTVKVNYAVMCLGKFMKTLVARLAFREPFF